ncbi:MULTISPECIES: acetyl-CoA hydrolase/transferase C-terminal domain-containing protein [Bacillaceae]|uniref:acetyl-CoA hydrolase/transferase family protein n=1 Tax=Bacillaceae TaxID=186817 RepID=UPI0006F84AB9|nr:MULTISPECIES: acetyl-CoA hydrolase/transferase C-terminal domain-containing protein [Bacillaceae]KQL35003.1 4-hydroxybutyrate CoA-transferase [Psychrobacillus sp. FJAT-21963]MDF2065342.1 acetyl-CoA hydrolase/transferase C-terminal domain-containing protein [Bacillus sp. Cr_A10]
MRDKQLSERQIIELIEKDADIILPLTNGEPHKLLDILEENTDALTNVKIHQLLALKHRKYMEGAFPGKLSHVSYFLSGATRNMFHQGLVDLVPNNFHEMPKILRQSTNLSMIMAVASPMDEYGYFSLGTQADIVSEFIGKVPFLLEVNKHMPRTFGENQIHISQIEGFVENDRPLFEDISPPIGDKDMRIASYVAESIQNGDTLQIGIGSIPNAVVSLLKDHRHLGIHTEMFVDGIVDLVEAGAIDGTQKFTNKGKIIATFAHGSNKIYNFLHNNPAVQFLPVSIVNDPREIAKEERIVSINATTEVDLFGQCASETVAGKYYSSTGGQADFARGVRFAKEGKGFVCMTSTAKNDEISRIQLRLSPGSVVTTSKNDIDTIVTEYGVAKMFGKPISERAKQLISIAHPKFREELTFEAKQMGFI